MLRASPPQHPFAPVHPSAIDAMEKELMEWTSTAHSPDDIPKNVPKILRDFDALPKQRHGSVSAFTLDPVQRHRSQVLEEARAQTQVMERLWQQFLQFRREQKLVLHAIKTIRLPRVLERAIGSGLPSAIAGERKPADSFPDQPELDIIAEEGAWMLRYTELVRAWMEAHPPRFEDRDTHRTGLLMLDNAVMRRRDYIDLHATRTSLSPTLKPGQRGNIILAARIERRMPAPARFFQGMMFALRKKAYRILEDEQGAQTLEALCGKTPGGPIASLTRVRRTIATAIAKRLHPSDGPEESPSQFA